MPTLDDQQNITLRLSRKTIQKARVLAAQHSTSISGLIASHIEQLVDADDEYQRAMQRATARLEKGFDLGGIHRMDRDALHER